MKNCSNKNCKEINPQSIKNFHKDNHLLDGLSSQCKNCKKYHQQKPEIKERNKQIKQIYYKNNIEKIQNYRNNLDTKLKLKEHKLIKKYNITIEKRNELCSQQNYKCAICGIDEINAGTKGLCIDHNHQTRSCSWFTL
jgi:hypothetical protein